MTKPHLSRILNFVLLGILCLVGVFWLIGSPGLGGDDREAWPEETDSSERDAARVMVTVEPVSFQQVQRVVEAVGTLHPYEEVSLSTKVEGQVRKLYHEVADRVPPGKRLLEIDDTDYELAVQQAERSLEVELAKLGLTEPPDGSFDLGKVPAVMQARARMENAEARLKRVRRLSGQQAITAEEVDNANADFLAAQAEYANQVLLGRAGQAAVRMKQASLAEARQRKTDTIIRAPLPTQPLPGNEKEVAYAIIHRAVAEGTHVRPGTEVFKLVLDGTLKLRVLVPERHTSEVKVGQKAQVTTAAYPHPFTGTVSRINPAVDPKTRTFEVEIQVDNVDGKLKSGSFAKARIVTRLTEVATVPLQSVVNFAGVTKVFLVEKGRAREMPVTLGVQSTQWVEVVKPVLPRDGQVVSSGQTALAQDTPVTIRKR